MLNRTLLATSLALLGSLTIPAQAYEANDLILRAGPAIVMTDATNHTALANLDAGDNTQVGLTVSWMLTPHIGVELLAATPFKHDITLGGATIGSTRHLPPTVSLQWFPSTSQVVQPYVGVGINHTFFFDTKNTLGVNLDLSSSTGLALEAGIDIRLKDNLLLNAAVWKIDINTDVRVNGTNQGELELDPLAAMVGMAYRF